MKVLIHTHGVTANRAQDQTKFVFLRYSDRYFLSQVWTAGDTAGRELRKSRAERELIKNGSKYLAKAVENPEVVYILAQ